VLGEDKGWRLPTFSIMGKVVLAPGRMIGEDDLRKFREIKVMIL
jgi:hypothetical protein